MYICVYSYQQDRKKISKNGPKPHSPRSEVVFSGPLIFRKMGHAYSPRSEVVFVGQKTGQLMGHAI